MAVTCGFYNALNHDRLYDAIQMSSIFDGIIRDGVFSTIGDSLIVTSPEDGMYVDVGPGRAWFNHTWTLNDTEYPVEAEEAEVVLDRIDAVVLEVNANPEVRNNRIYFVKGTPSSNPVKPTMIHNAEVNQYALAYVTIRAGQTTIFQQDIENVVGTDETPFVTGLLQQVSVEQLLLQWNDDFYRYFAAFQSHNNAEFNTWMEAKVAEYNDWYAAMELEGAHDLEVFDTWFQHMKDQLDEDAAGHLQAEIDELAEACEKGSVFTVSTEEPELVGRSCVVSQGSDSVIKTFNSSGVAEFPSMPYIGSIHVEATDGDNVAQGEMTIPYFGRYSMSIAFWAATLNISTSADGLMGRPITITKGGVVVGTTSFNASGRATYKVHEPGTYIVSSSTAGGDEYSATVVVTEETAYPVNLGIPSGATATPTDDIQTWLKCASIYDKSYTLLNDVLEDYYTCERLFSDSNACDYMARSSSWAAIVTTDASVMEQIGKYDYCKLALLSNETWANAISTSLSPVKGMIPDMTSETAPSGQVVKSAQQNAYRAAWKAFDANEKTFWASGTNIGEYIGYVFPNTVSKITHIQFRGGNYYNTSHTFHFTVQTTTDGSTWVDADTWDLTPSQVTYDSDADLINSPIYIYCKKVDLTNVRGVRIIAKNEKIYDSSNSIMLVTGDLQFIDSDSNVDLIHSAANDTVYYYDSNNVERQLCVTDANGNGTVDWSEMEPGIYTFYSTVAKNPDNLSEEYSKTVKITKTTTEVYLMPGNSTYWHGFFGDDYEELSAANGWTISVQTASPTRNANSLGLSSTANTNASGACTKREVTGVASVIVSTSAAYGGYYGDLINSSRKDTTSSYDIERTRVPSAVNFTRYNTKTAVSRYVTWCAYYGMINTLFAFWHRTERELTVFSAANDTIYYLGENNVHIPFAKTDETGTASVDLGLIPQGTYTLYSSVAKDPDNLSNPYSKTVTIGPDTKSVKVMPDGALYWYGWRKCDFLSTGYATWVQNYGTITFYPNYMMFVGSSSSGSGSAGRVLAFVCEESINCRAGQVVKAHAYDKNWSGSGDYNYLCARTNRDVVTDRTAENEAFIPATATSGTGQTQPLPADGNYYPTIGFRSSSTPVNDRVKIDWWIVDDAD